MHFLSDLDIVYYGVYGEIRKFVNLICKVFKELKSVKTLQRQNVVNWFSLRNVFAKKANM